MELYAAQAMIMVLSENTKLYSDKTKRAVLDGIFQLAQECKEELALDPHPGNAEAQISLSVAKNFASSALKTERLDDGLQAVGECFWPMSTSRTSSR